MPTVLRLKGCEWRIYMDDHQPPHCHIKVGDGTVVVNLDATASIRKTSNKVKASNVKKAQDLTIDNLDLLLQAWSNIHETDEE